MVLPPGSVTTMRVTDGEALALATSGVPPVQNMTLVPSAAVVGRQELALVPPPLATTQVPHEPI